MGMFSNIQSPGTRRIQIVGNSEAARYILKPNKFLRKQIDKLKSLPTASLVKELCEDVTTHKILMDRMTKVQAYGMPVFYEVDLVSSNTRNNSAIDIRDQFDDVFIELQQLGFERHSSSLTTRSIMTLEIYSNDSSNDCTKFH